MWNMNELKERVITKLGFWEEGDREVMRKSKESSEVGREGNSWSSVGLMCELGRWSNLWRRGFEFDLELEEWLRKKKLCGILPL